MYPTVDSGLTITKNLNVGGSEFQTIGSVKGLKVAKSCRMYCLATMLQTDRQMRSIMPVADHLARQYNRLMKNTRNRHGGYSKNSQSLE